MGSNDVPATNEGAIAFLETHDYESEAILADHDEFDAEYVDRVMIPVAL